MGVRLVACLLGGALGCLACGRSAPLLADLGGASGGTQAATGGSFAIGGSSGSVSQGGSGGLAGAISGGTAGGDPCPRQPVAGQRIVRLSFDQISYALIDLVGTTAALTIDANDPLATLQDRSFPPLQSASEGSLVTDAVWQRGDRIAQAIGTYVFNNLPVVTGCDFPIADDCARAFAARFAERAFRRPLTADELDNLMTVYAEAQAAGGTIEQATQHVVYAVLESPLFLYRTELGEASAPSVEVPLTAYETASLLSFFLTNGPPDAVLLGHAADGTISRPEVLESQIARLLELPVTKVNFETAMLSYLGLPAASDVMIDPSLADPSVFTLGLRNSMFHEVELFLQDRLWDGGPLAELLVSRSSRINDPLARFYGLVSATPNPDVFTQVTLPEERSGLLTMPGFLIAHAKPDELAVTSRGALVNALIACQTNPSVHPTDDSFDPVQGAGTEREAAEFRAQTAVCAGCHTSFDGFGLALERFDIIGRYRTTDAQGRHIDPNVRLPDSANGDEVSSVQQMGAALARPELFNACLAEAFLRFALAEPLEDVDGGCAVREVVWAQSASGDPTFPRLVSEIARSWALVSRRRESP